MFNTGISSSSVTLITAIPEIAISTENGVDSGNTEVKFRTSKRNLNKMHNNA